MIERGIVREIRNEVAEVEVTPAAPEACASCGSCSESPSGRTLRVRAPRGLEIGIGSHVQVEVEEGDEASLGAAAVVFLLPVLSIVLGAALGTEAPTWLGANGFPEALGGFLGAAVLLAGAILAIRTYDSRFSRSRPRSKITGILH